MAFSGRRRWLPGLHPKTTSSNDRSTKTSRASQRHRSCLFEALETRALLSATSLSDIIAQPAVSGGYTAAQITSAYLASNLKLITSLKGSITGDGSGQTIAIVDAYNDPNIAGDVAAFSSKFGLSTASLKVVSQTGSSTLPTTNSDWSVEISLDVEWAHAIAPGANILLVEAKSASLTDLLTAVKYASNQPGVSVVSMSWGTNEFRGETSYDSYFTTPTGHIGVTFVASSGDSGTTSWPAVASNVLAVGGTTLTLTSSNAYSSETAWSDSGGGVSSYEALPAYQKMIGVSASGRVTPDVSYDADPNTGFLVYDSVGSSGGWMEVGGTSAGAPQWAGIIAIANEGRVANGLSTLTQANAMIYTIYDTSATKSAQDFYDVTSGRNTSGFGAVKGYDAVTGLGSPKVSYLVGDLATATLTSGPTSTTKITIGTTQGFGGWGGLGGWGGWGGGWGGRGGWSGWWSPFDMTAGSGQLSAPAALPLSAGSDSSPTLHTQSAATTQVVVAPIADVSTTYVSSTPREVRSTTWERGLNDSSPGVDYTSETDEATAAIFGSSSPDGRLGIDIPATPQSRVAGAVFVESLPSESDDAAAMVDGQPQLAPEDTESSAPAPVHSQNRTQQPPADVAVGSAVELSGSTIAALVFAWQLRVDSVAAEKERRYVNKAS